MTKRVNCVLYQKIGVTVSNLAIALLSKDVGDRIPSISDFQQEFGVSRGTLQNAFSYLEETGAVTLTRHGHCGTFIEGLDRKKLQENCVRQEILGIMPLPYSRTYEGFATAIYEQMKGLHFNMAYARGAEGRIRLVESGTYHFAVVSRYAAEDAAHSGRKIETLIDFGPESFLSRHILLVRNQEADGIQDGMKVAYDEDSLDQSSITRSLIKGKRVELVRLRTQQTIGALLSGDIDAGVWNYDVVAEDPRLKGFKVIELGNKGYDPRFAEAVLVIRKGNTYLKELLQKYITVEATRRIQKTVMEGEMLPYC